MHGHTSPAAARRLAELRRRLAARYPTLGVEVDEFPGISTCIRFSAPTADELGAALDAVGLCRREAFEQLLAWHRQGVPQHRHRGHPHTHDEFGNRWYVSRGFPDARLTVIVEPHGSELLEARVATVKARREVARLLKPFLRAGT